MLFPCVTLSQHLTVARLVARVSCFVYCICVRSLSLSPHTHSASLAAGRHTWLHFISPSSIPVFIYLFIFPPPPFISHLLRQLSREALGMLLYHWLWPIALGKERRSDLQLDTCTQFSKFCCCTFECYFLMWPSCFKRFSLSKKVQVAMLMK